VRAVLDTNIVASASFWRGKPFSILTAWARGKFTAVVSPQMLSEYFETIGELAARYPKKSRTEWAEGLTASADLVFPTDRATGAVKDPDDEIVLECALAGRADYIISGDKTHLLALREWRGIKLVSADAFLALL